MSDWHVNKWRECPDEEGYVIENEEGRRLRAFLIDGDGEDYFAYKTPKEALEWMLGAGLLKEDDLRNGEKWVSVLSGIEEMTRTRVYAVDLGGNCRLKELERIEQWWKPEWDSYVVRNDANEQVRDK